MMEVKWTEQLLIDEALKYKSRSEFAKNSGSAYYTSLKRGILDYVCNHMDGRFYWTKDILRKEALKYKTRIEFTRCNDRAYRASLKLGILDEICKHMDKLGNLKKRFIYVIEFENRSVYVGLTCNLERRKLEHISNSTNKNINNLILSGFKFTFNSDNVLYNVYEASQKECLLIEEYRKVGYNILNIAKGGGIGGNNLKWTKDVLVEEALKYKTKIEFYKSNRVAYDSASRMCILDEICKHMCSKFKKWTHDMLKEEALKYNNKSDFLKNGKGAYIASKRRGIFDEICSHMNH